MSQVCWDCKHYQKNNYDDCCTLTGSKVEPLAENECKNFVVKKIMVPCYVKVQRFYKCWIEATMKSTQEQVTQAMTEAILNDPEGTLIEEDPDIEVEVQDIEAINVDWDGVQPCDEDESEEK